MPDEDSARQEQSRQEQGNGPEPDSAVEMLSNEEDEVSDEFIERVRAKIHRRAVTAQFSSFSWRMTGVIFLELVRFLGFVPRTLSGGGDRWKSERS